MRSISSRLRTSQDRARVRSAWPIRTRAASALAASRESKTTLAPRSANRRARDSPIPIEPPVTTTTSPEISMLVLLDFDAIVSQALAYNREHPYWRVFEALASTVSPACRAISRHTLAAPHIRAAVQRADLRMSGEQNALRHRAGESRARRRSQRGRRRRRTSGSRTRASAFRCWLYGGDSRGHQDIPRRTHGYRNRGAGALRGSRHRRGATFPARRCAVFRRRSRERRRRGNRARGQTA